MMMVVVRAVMAGMGGGAGCRRAQHGQGKKGGDQAFHGHFSKSVLEILPGPRRCHQTACPVVVEDEIKAEYLNVA